MIAWWESTKGPALAQGDYLLGCLIPVFEPDFGSAGQDQEVPVAKADLIVVTQSCDLENNKVLFAALCPIYSLAKFEEANPSFRKKWEEVRKGRMEGLHLIASPIHPEDNRQALVVDFRVIYSLPVSYLAKHADSMNDRWRLRSPFLEHFSQAFARFFMRVGLPSALAPYR